MTHLSIFCSISPRLFYEQPSGTRFHSLACKTNTRVFVNDSEMLDHAHMEQGRGPPRGGSSAAVAPFDAILASAETNRILSDAATEASSNQLWEEELPLRTASWRRCHPSCHCSSLPQPSGTSDGASATVNSHLS